MIRTLAVVCTFFIVLAACSKKSSNDTVVRYEVVASNSSSTAITYNNVLQQKVQVSAQNSWSIEIGGPTKPYTAYIQAACTSPFSSVQTTCTVNILVNGAVVKTTTISSNTTAVATAEFVVQ